MFAARRAVIRSSSSPTAWPPCLSVFVGGGVENCVGSKLGKEALDRRFIGYVDKPLEKARTRVCGHCAERSLKLLPDLEQREFIGFDQHQSSGVLGNDLAANLASD